MLDDGETLPLQTEGTQRRCIDYLHTTTLPYSPPSGNQESRKKKSNCEDGKRPERASVQNRSVTAEVAQAPI